MTKPIDYNAIIAHYFSRQVARTKELSTGSIHVAFEDGTMAVYSKDFITLMSKEMELWAENEVRRRNSYEALSGHNKTTINYLIH